MCFTAGKEEYGGSRHRSAMCLRWQDDEEKGVNGAGRLCDRIFGGCPSVHRGCVRSGEICRQLQNRDAATAKKSDK